MRSYRSTSRAECPLGCPPCVSCGHVEIGHFQIRWVGEQSKINMNMEMILRIAADVYSEDDGRDTRCYSD